jgi:hypothetical protein
MNKITKLLPVILPLLVMATILVSPTAFAQNPSGMINCISIEDNTTSVAGPSPSKNLNLGVNNETAAGFSNITDVEKSTGSNRAIFLNNTDISNPGLTVAEGLEKSQLGNKIAGQQDTIMEGAILNNITDICWQK